MKNSQEVTELVEEVGFLLLDWALHPEVDPGCGPPMDLIFTGQRNGSFVFHFPWSTGILARYSGWVGRSGKDPGTACCLAKPFKESPVVKAEK